jgi:hypothetical protein
MLRGYKRYLWDVKQYSAGGGGVFFVLRGVEIMSHETDV